MPAENWIANEWPPVSNCENKRGVLTGLVRRVITKNLNLFRIGGPLPPPPGIQLGKGAPFGGHFEKVQAIASRGP